jgi:hypothetical protein
MSEYFTGFVFLALIVVFFVAYEVKAKKNQQPKVAADPNNPPGSVSLEEAVKKATGQQ